MENNSIDNQINSLMQERRQGFNDYTKKMIGDNNYLQGFDERYYLRDDSRKKIPKVYSASGKMDDLSNVFEDEVSAETRKTLKEKALELETLIVDALVREKFDESRMLFETLRKMYNKHNDDNVKDIYLRVRSAMPKNLPKRNTYSVQNDKNKFKEVLDSMSNSDNVSAYNDNQCMSKLGEMWDTCDRNICSDKCKERIMDAYTQSKKEDCQETVTSTNNGKEITLKDDIKNVIIERLQYCKRIQDLDKSTESISYSDVQDLKNKTIEDIMRITRLANLHYHSCQNKAEDYIAKDPKLARIVNMVSELDLSKLNLDKLQQIRSDLSLLPSCDKIRYDEFQEKRDKNLKEGLRVGKYIIPQDSDYYRQLQEAGKENPTIYKDLVTGKDYFYDAFSKTLTGIKYPETREIESVTEPPAEPPSIPPADTRLEEIDMEALLGLDELEKVPADSPSLSLEQAGPTESLSINNVNNNLNSNIKNVLEHPNVVPAVSNVRDIINLKPVEEEEEETSLIFGLNLNNVLSYILILLVILAVVYMLVQRLQKQ